MAPPSRATTTTLDDLDVERRTARKAVQPAPNKEADIRTKTVPKFDEPTPPPTDKAAGEKKDHPRPSVQGL